MTDPLIDIIPAKRRKAVYAVLALIGLIITGLFAGFTSGGSTIPGWLVFTSAFYNAVVVPILTLARSNAR